MSIADNIRTCREYHDMLQSELGKKLGVSAQAVSKWECGKSQPDCDAILSMCKLFQISADELLGNDTNEYIVVDDASEELTEDEKKLLEDYRFLNANGKVYARQTMAMLKHLYEQGNVIPDVEVG